MKGLEILVLQRQGEPRTLGRLEIKPLPEEPSERYDAICVKKDPW